MTEKDLYQFLNHDKEIKSLYSEYKLCGVYMSEPKSPNMTSIPGGNGGEDKLMELMDRRKSIYRKIEERVALRDIAERELDRVAAKISDDLQLKVFKMLYKIGYDVPEIAATLSYHKSHIYRQRRAILKLVAPL